MSLSLIAIQQRSPTRIRLKFDGAVAGAGLGAAALANYSAAESYDGSATAARVWTVTGAIAIASDSSAIELVLSSPVSDGAWLWVVFNAPVVAVAGGPFAGPVSPTIRMAEKVPPPSPEVPQTDLDGILWGEDIAFADGDWVEDASGDLSTTTGQRNAVDAIARRLLSEGLQWDDSYGLRPSRFVDAPSVLAQSIRGEAQAQAAADDRVVATASSVGLPDPNDPTTTIIETKLTFFSGQSASVSTPIGGA